MDAQTPHRSEALADSYVLGEVDYFGRPTRKNALVTAESRRRPSPWDDAITAAAVRSGSLNDPIPF